MLMPARVVAYGRVIGKGKGEVGRKVIRIQRDVNVMCVCAYHSIDIGVQRNRRVDATCRV